MSGGEVVEEFSSLVNPGVRIPSHIEQFTGIGNDMVADAPPFADIAGEVLERLEGRLFVAHNARFDYGFLRTEFRRLDRRFRAPVLCTVKLSRRVDPGVRGHNLDAVMERHGLSCAARHRALGDARVLADLLTTLRARPDVAALDAIIEDLVREVPLPPQLDPALSDELPEAPGVYRFWGEGGALLYVGKSKNLRTRVLAHFAGDHRSSKELKLSRLVRRVDWTETAGELGALLKEARWVKEMAPLANRRLRPSNGVFTIVLTPDGAGVRAGTSLFSFADAGAPHDEKGKLECPLPEYFGLFRSGKDAEKALAGLVREHRLCARVLGLEDGDGSCFGYQVGRCRGACVGLEPIALHAARTRLALARHKLRDWPFRGRIGIRERDWRGLTEIHVFDRWHYLGSVSSDQDLADLAGPVGNFDLDCYRILGSYLDRPPAQARILELD